MSVNNNIKKTALVTGLLGLTSISSAQAIPVSIVFGKVNMEVRSSSYQVTSADDATSLMNAFNSGTLLCNTDLTEFTGVGGPQNCGTSNRDLATLYTIDYQIAGGPILFELGADWGRGGMIMNADGGDILRTDDIWWSRSWGNNDVIDFSISEPGRGSLQLLGFEGCCSGYNSLRYSIDDGQSFSSISSFSGVMETVSEPASLALIGLGLIGIGVTRRRKT